MPTYPAGVITRDVVLPAVSDSAGNLVNGLLTIIPSLTMKWEATQQVVLGDPITANVVNGTATVRLPIVQSGFLLKNGTRVDAWTYTASVLLTGRPDLSDLTFILPADNEDDPYLLDFEVPNEILPTVLTVTEYQSVVGEPGPANTLAIGEVTSGPVADATITGDAPSQVLSFTIPEPTPELVTESINAFTSSAGTSALTTVPDRLDNVWRYQQSSYSQDNIVTLDDGTIYMVWLRTGDVHPIVGKLAPGSKVWQKFDLRTVAGDPFGNQTPDGHNTFVLGVDPQGNIHASGNMHGVALKYVKTTTPGDITTFAVRAMVGTQEGSVSYPSFITTSDGKFYFIYRNGTSGQGNDYLNIWNGADWVRVATVFDGDASAESPYMNRIAPDHVGGLHFMVVWREAADADTNTDPTYLHYTGTQWLRSDGTVQPMPVTHANAEIITSIEHGEGLINQTGLDVDINNLPHGVFTWYDSNGKSQYYHVYLDSNRDWHIEQVSAFTDRVETVGVVGTLNLIVARPQIVCTSLGKTYVIGRAWSTLQNHAHIIDVSTPGNPIASLFDMNLTTWEPSFDLRSLRRGDLLRMLVTDLDSPATSGDGFDNEWGGILDIQLNNLSLAAASAPAFGSSDAGRVPDSMFKGPLTVSTDLNTLGSVEHVGAWLMGTGVALVNQPVYGVTRPATLEIAKPHRAVTVQRITDAESQVFTRVCTSGTWSPWTVSTGGALSALANGTDLSTLWHGDYFMTNTSAYPNEPADFAALSPAQHGLLEVRLVSSSGGTSGIKFYRLTSFDRTKVWEATMSSGVLSAWVQTRGGQGTAAPATTPSFVGQIFVDTTAAKAYVAKGTASSADWVILN